MAFRRDEHREVCPSFYAVHRSPWKIINGVGESRALHAWSKNIRSILRAEMFWNGLEIPFENIKREKYSESDDNGLFARNFFSAASVDLYSVRESINFSRIQTFEK